MTSKARVVSVAFGLSGFAVALVSGVGAGNDASVVLLRAIAAMFACQLLGVLVGSMVERLIEEQVARYKESHPIPVVPSLTAARRDGIVEVAEVVDETGKTHAAP
jgi:uncharacterized protein with ACT and thioredoxin-like domain